MEIALRIIIRSILNISRNPEVDNKKRFTEVCEAYDVLSSPKWKILFDQFGEEAIKTGVPVPPIGNESEGSIEIYTFHGCPSKVSIIIFT